MYRCLIADDEPMIRYSIKYMLETSGLPVESVREADNGLVALEILETDDVDFVFIDINMPKMNGLDLAKEIFEQYPEIIMCIISGYDDFKYAQKAIRYGVRAYLLKPVNGIELKHALMDMMEKKRGRAGNWLKHEDFRDYVDRIFEAVREKNQEKMREQASCFLKDISHMNEINHGGLINDLVSGVYTNAVQMTNASDLSPAPMGGIQDKNSQRKWLTDSLDVLFHEFSMLYKNPGTRIVEAAKKKMEKEGGWNLSLEDISAEFGVSSSYFSRIFREETGVTFVAYRTILRMEKAAALLTVPGNSISSIAFEVGYNDATHFIRTFKKHTGMSPSDYRKQEKI